MLQDAALAMIAAASAERSLVATLRARCPSIYRQLRQDARWPDLFALWGRCVNFDDEARQVIVHPAILRGLGKVAGIPMPGRIVHAGLQHTYGYLFSVISTRYGFKRDRWVSTDLERGLGIDLSLLGEQPAAGTLLANATWLLGQVAFRGRPAALASLGRLAPAVAPALVAYNFGSLSVSRLQECAALPGKVTRQVTLVTDLLTLPHTLDGDRLLIYSAQAGARAPLRLITAFPVRLAVVHELQAAAKAKQAAEIRLRYNAYVPGLYGRSLPGQRLWLHA
jgi:hypothetical protein